MSKPPKNESDRLWPLLECSLDGILIVSADTWCADDLPIVAAEPWHVVRANPMAGVWLEAAPSELVGRSVSELFDAESGAFVVRELDKILGDWPTNRHFLVNLSSKNERSRSFGCRIRRLISSSDHVGILLTTTYRDEFPTRIDPLTRLLDRSHLLDRLARLLGPSRGSNEKFALLFIDLDDFKAINDRYGHLVGDQVLQWAALRVKECLKLNEHETVVRYGGDEFAVLISGDADTTRVDEIAKAIGTSFEQTIEVPDGRVSLTASVGVAWGPEDFWSPNEVLEAADRAMYAAKRGK
ncbi:MAG TPA: sensor domain-containing diguanylate cyclase [Lacipirellulaceae bacterium]|nr:sensor domain-containing diguanylate cyclase [Lacipirellulaceae bacterium]